VRTIVTEERARWCKLSALCALPSLGWAFRIGYHRLVDLAIMLGVILLFGLGLAELESRNRSSAARDDDFWSGLATAVRLKIAIGLPAAAMSQFLFGEVARMLGRAGLLLSLITSIGSDIYTGAAGVLLARAITSDDSPLGIFLTALTQGVLLLAEVLLLAVLVARARRPPSPFSA
jgi:hypothetical protein